jgi:hypothetical protein
MREPCRRRHDDDQRLRKEGRRRSDQTASIPQRALIAAPSNAPSGRAPKVAVLLSAETRPIIRSGVIA